MSEHWYDSEGNPRYTIIGANGVERDTTLRDARKLNLSPSSTTIMNGMAKPGLDNYIQTQLLDAAVSVKASNKTEEEWRKAVIKKSREHSSKAASKGTEIHDALESYYLGNEKFAGHDKKTREICLHVVGLLIEQFGNIKWSPERSFTHKLGFGGKVDMSYNDLETQLVLDFKTKDKTEEQLLKMFPEVKRDDTYAGALILRDARWVRGNVFDENGMQTASYAVGLDMPQARRYNLYISTQKPGVMVLTESIDFERDWGMFEALLKLWQHKNKYIPEA